MIEGSEYEIISVEKIAITKKEIKDFATQNLGLEYDEEKNEFYCLRGEFAPIELVGTRVVSSEEEILKSLLTHPKTLQLLTA